MCILTEWSSIRWILASLALLCVVAIGADGTQSGPKLSTYAPSRDLALQLQKYVHGLRRDMRNEVTYVDYSERIAGQANALVFIGVALGLHDEDTKYRSSSRSIVQAAKELASAEDYAKAKPAAARLRIAVEGQAEPGDVIQWGVKAVSLHSLMVELEAVFVRLDYARRHFETSTAECAQRAAVLATIGHGLTSDPQAVRPRRVMVVPATLAGLSAADQWMHLCRQMRDSAGALNQAAHRRDQAGVHTVILDLRKSCSDCHAIFR